MRVRKQRELDGLLARDKELDMLFERLYEDNVAGKIDDARFAKMAKRYEQEQGENGKRIKALRLELKQSESKRMDIDDFLTTVRRYTNAAKITKRMVGELIDHIDVYQAEKQDGVTTQRVVIHYNCIGAFDVPDRRKIPEADIIMETRKGVGSQLRPGGVKVVWDMRAFLYCRVAHDDSFALEHQRFLLQIYAKQAGYTIIGAADEYGSGLTLDRPVLQKVTEAVVAGKVDVVLVHNLTRIGREWGMTQRYIELLTRHKVKLLCIRDRLLFDENGVAPILAIKKCGVSFVGYSDPIRTLRMVRVTGLEPAAS